MSDLKALSGQSILKIASAIVPSGLGHFLDLLGKGSDALADTLKARDEKRWQSFVSAALEGDVFPENAEYLTDEEFLEMYRMCLNDIEAEKAELYGRLATSIATGRVPVTLRFPLMHSLSQLTHGQVQRMRKAYVAEVHELVADGYMYRRHAHEFLGGQTLEDQWDLDRMSTLLVVKQESLTDLGKKLVDACFRADHLQPSSIGERTWNGVAALEVLRIADRGGRNDVLEDVATQLAKQARDNGRKVDFISMRPEGGFADPSPLGFPCFAVLVGSTSKQLMKCLEMIGERVALGKTPIFASPGPIPDALRAAFPQAKYIENEAEPAVLAERVLDAVKAMLTGIGDTF